MKIQLLFVVLLLSFFSQIGYSQYYNILDAEFEDFLVANRQNDRVFSLDSIIKTRYSGGSELDFKFIVSEKNNDHNIIKAKISAIGSNYTPRRDSITMNYHNEDQIRSYLRKNNRTNPDTSEYLEFNLDNQLILEQYKFESFCGTGNPYNQRRTIYQYNSSGDRINSLVQLKWDDCVNEGWPGNIWVDHYNVDYTYESEKPTNEYHRSNLWREGSDTVYLQLFPYLNKIITYKGGQIDIVLYQLWDSLGQSWINSYEEKYLYVSDSTIIEKSNWNISDQHWERSEKSVNYNKYANDNFISFTWNANTNKWEFARSSEYVYSGDTLVNIKKTVHNWNQKYHYLYNNSGKLVLKEKYQYIKSETKWRLHEETVNTYDYYNNLTKSILRRYNDSDTTKAILDYYWHTDFKSLNNNSALINQRNQWNIAHWSMSGPINNSVKLRFSGDSLKMGDYHYTELLNSSEESGNYWNGTGMYFREQDQKVWQYFDDGEIVLYDFALEVGDTFNSKFFEDFETFLVVEEIDSFTLDNGEKRKMLKLRCPYVLQAEKTWIEGIGDLLGLLEVKRSCTTDINSSLLCYYNSDEMLFRNPDHNTCWISSNDNLYESNLIIYPNPVDSKLVIQTDYEVSEVDIIDSDGRILITAKDNVVNTADLNTGIFFIKIYFRDGKMASGKFVKQ